MMVRPPTKGRKLNLGGRDLNNGVERRKNKYTQMY